MIKGRIHLLQREIVRKPALQDYKVMTSHRIGLPKNMPREKTSITTDDVEWAPGVANWKKITECCQTPVYNTQASVQIRKLFT